MTGTASELYDSAESTNNQSNNINLLSSWLFGKINTGCILMDISECGCSVLIPRKLSTSPELFDLVIMHPQNNEKVMVVLQGEHRWVIRNYTSRYKKTGIKFHNITPENKLAIKLLGEHLSQRENAEIKCNLVNH